jgi:hypothetical protein
MRHTTTTGHLQHGSLHLQQTESVRKELSSAAKARYALMRLPAPKLDWMSKERKAK